MSSDPRGYYADLGLSPTASIDEIKAVYRALAKIYHPDVNKDRAATEKFRKITEAYEVLGDYQKRAAYHASGAASSGSSNARAGAASGSANSGSSNASTGAEIKKTPAKSTLLAGQVVMACAIIALALFAANSLQSSFSWPTLASLGFMEAPTQPNQHPISSVLGTPVTPQYKVGEAMPIDYVPDFCLRRPANGHVFERNVRRLKNGHQLTIRNGSSGAGIIKVRDAQSRRLALSFYVEKGMTASVAGIPDGSYVVQYGYGGDDGMNEDCRSFVEPGAAEFDGVQTLQTERTGTQITTQELSLTLYQVANGNATTSVVGKDDFDAD